MLRYVIGLVAVLTIFSSCTTEVNLTGEYTEKAVVFALLDPNNNPSNSGDGHLFRIQKAFLGEESAFIMASRPDSSYFKYEDLFVELIEYDGANETNRWQLDTVMIGNKDEGDPDDGVIDFFGPEQRLYRTEADIPFGNVNIDATLDYEITLKKRPLHIGVGDMTFANMDTVASIADAVTDLVNTEVFRWNTPNENSPSFPGTTRKMDLFNTAGDFKDYTLRFDVAERARQYEVWLRFYYREVVQSVETEKFIEWKVSTFELDPNISDWQVSLSSESIYSRIGSEIEAAPNVIRYIGLAENHATDPHPNDNQSHDFDISIRLAGDELYEYIDINNPSNQGALQDKPVYTNINNGLGLFSSRSTVPFPGMYLSVSAGQQLVTGTYTSSLGFVDD
ncbi:MAG: hypothetical protein ACI9CU_001612 [Polaribacter sp.]|jgi:hypothetical protein